MMVEHSSIHFWHAALRVRSAKRRHQSPEWAILSHINCFVHGAVTQPGFSFGWGTTQLSFAFFLPSPILLFPHILPSPLYIPSRPSFALLFFSAISTLRHCQGEVKQDRQDLRMLLHVTDNVVKGQEIPNVKTSAGVLIVYQHVICGEECGHFDHGYSQSLQRFILCGWVLSSSDSNATNPRRCWKYMYTSKQTAA